MLMVSTTLTLLPRQLAMRTASSPSNTSAENGVMRSTSGIDKDWYCPLVLQAPRCSGKSTVTGRYPSVLDTDTFFRGMYTFESDLFRAIAEYRPAIILTNVIQYNFTSLFFDVLTWRLSDDLWDSALSIRDGATLSVVKKRFKAMFGLSIEDQLTLVNQRTCVFQSWHQLDVSVNQFIRSRLWKK